MSASRRRPETVRLVEVPMVVMTPPSTAAKLTGMRNRDTASRRREAMSMTAGTVIATRAVLFRNAEIPVSGKRSRARSTLVPRTPLKRASTTGCMMPATSTARATTSRAAMMKGASLLKPANASSAPMMPSRNSSMDAANIATAGGTSSRAIRTIRMRMTPRVIQACSSIYEGVIGG
jgi:hypothetical protein